MTTSGTYSFSVNRDQIIRQAMLNIRALSGTETPTSEETSDCAFVLNMLVKQWQGVSDFAPGLKSWTRRHGHLFLSATTGTYLVGPNATGWTNSYVSTTTTAVTNAGNNVIPVTSTSGMTIGDNFGVQLASGALFWSTISLINSLNVTLVANVPSATKLGGIVYDYTTTAQQPLVIETAFLRDQYGNDSPLAILPTISDYDKLASKANPTNVSDPSSIFYEFQLTNSYLYTDVDGVTDVTKHIGMSYLESIQDFNNPADTPEYPQEWFLALAWGLSEQIAPMFDRPWTQVHATAKANALTIAQNKGPKMSSEFFQPG